MVKVEYLLPFNTKDGICKDIQSFNSLLQSHTDITITSSKLKFKGSSYEYSVNMNEVPDQDCTVFHVTLEISHITDKFREMLKSFKKVVGVHLKDDIQIIWDGIGFEWSKQLYPRIYQVENLMRKLISKFMLINLGIGWHKSVTPLEVKDSIKQSRTTNHGILYEVDFIQLSHFLFKQYALKDASKLPDVISEALDGDLTAEKREEILDFIPKNNWDRYISKIVDCESEQLKKKWTNLYTIRCKVAHNSSMSVTDFDDGIKLCDFLEPILQSAFNSLSNVKIPKDKIENISLNTIGTIHEPTKQFANDYYKVATGISDVLKEHSDTFKNLSFNDLSSPINTFLKSPIENMNVSASLISSLNHMEIMKNSFLVSESIGNLNELTNSYANLIIDSNFKVFNEFENPKVSDLLYIQKKDDSED
jgi:hypothetical protein